MPAQPLVRGLVGGREAAPFVPIDLEEFGAAELQSAQVKPRGRTNALNRRPFTVAGFASALAKVAAARGLSRIVSCSKSTWSALIAAA